MKRIFSVALVALLLTACVQEPVSMSKVDPAAGARDRVAIAAEHLRNGDDEKAQLQVRRALDLDRRSPEAYNMLGILLDRDGDKRGAEKAYKKAVKLRSNFSQAHNNYAVFLFKNGKYKKAYKQFELAAQDLSYDLRPQAFEGMGRSALKLGKKSEAQHAFIRALKANPDLPGALLELADLQFQQGELNSARTAYLRFLTLTEKIPQTAQSLWLGIRIERQLGDKGDKNALASYELALKRLYPASEEYKRYQESLKH